MNLKKTAMETIQNETQREEKWTEYQQAVGQNHTGYWSNTQVVEVTEGERGGQKKCLKEQ